jgi:hypothetical protein
MHRKALERKHQDIEQIIHEESLHAASDGLKIRRLKEAKLHLKEAIERMKETEH